MHNSRPWLHLQSGQQWQQLLHWHGAEVWALQRDPSIIQNAALPGDVTGGVDVVAYGSEGVCMCAAAKQCCYSIQVHGSRTV
jgi:hypothetical protein